MQIKYTSQLWQFVDRYCSYWFSYKFENDEGDICALVRGIVEATLKCACLVFLVSVFLLALFTSWYAVWMTGNPVIPDDNGIISILGMAGFMIQILVIGFTFFLGIRCISIQLLNTRKKKVKKETPEWLKVTREYIAARKEKYCTRVELIR